MKNKVIAMMFKVVVSTTLITYAYLTVGLFCCDNYNSYTALFKSSAVHIPAKGGLLNSLAFLLPGDALAEETQGIQQLVQSTVDLYNKEGDRLDVNDRKSAIKYLSLMSKRLDLIISQHNKLDGKTKKILSNAINDYGLALIKKKEPPSKDNVEKATQLYIVSLGLNPQNTATLRNLGIHYYSREKKYKKALDYYEKVLSIEPGNLVAKIYRRKCLKKLESITGGPGPEKNLADIRKSYFRGLRYWKNGKYEKSEKIFQDIITRDSKHSDAQFMLGQTYLKMGNYEKAIYHLQLAEKIERESSNGNLYMTTLALAQAYLSANNISLAKQKASETVKLIKEKGSMNSGDQERLNDANTILSKCQ